MNLDELKPRADRGHGMQPRDELTLVLAPIHPLHEGCAP